MLDVKSIYQFFGSQKLLAKRLGYTTQALTRWEKYGVPPGAAIKIEKLSNGKFKAVDIPIYKNIYELTK